MNKEKALKIVIIGLGLVIFGVVGAVAGMKYSSRPDFCTNCHLMKPAVAAWASTPHKGVTCLDCHADPGTVGYVKQKMRGLQELYIYLSGGYDGKFEVKFNTVNCINCHSKTSKFETAKDVTSIEGPRAPAFPHLQFVERNTSCVDCHKNFVHTRKSPEGPQSKTEVCLACHVNVKVDKMKDITLAEGPKAPKYPHGELVKAKVSCVDCHKDLVHGKKAESGDKNKICLTCHSNSKVDSIKDVRTTGGSRAAAFPHQDLLKANMSCQGCHSDVHGAKAVK